MIAPLRRLPSDARDASTDTRGIVRTGNRGTHVSYQGSEAGRFSDLPRFAKAAGIVAAVALAYGVATHLPFASVGAASVMLPELPTVMPTRLRVSMMTAGSTVSVWSAISARLAPLVA